MNQPQSLILEGLLTTVSPGPGPLTDRVNIAPMGPRVDLDLTRWELRPFQTATTYRNLTATGQAVFHVVDDVLLLARAAVGKVEPGPDIPMAPARSVQGVVLTDACRYYELTVQQAVHTPPRASFTMRVVDQQRLRDYLGLNRARHAVLEAAILATRLHLTGQQAVLDQFQPLQVIVDKTGTDREQQAMDELRHYVSHWVNHWSET